MNNKKIIFLLLLGILTLDFFSASIISNGIQSGIFSDSEDVGTCVGTGQDLIVHIPLLGCSPTVVRSDLLEENDVPVYCKISAIALNPLINIESIDSISFSGNYNSSQIAGIKFSPAHSAISTKSYDLENAGYVVIYLKKQPNSSAMPEYVSGNLTAKVKYTLKSGVNLGGVTYYLSELKDDDEWEENKYKYSFWNNEGYLRLESLGDNDARVSVYSKDGKISTLNLEKGVTSNAVYLPGFECKTGIRLKLNSLENPATKARLNINSDTFELGLNEKFLDNKCIINSINQDGIKEQVTVKCSEDDGTKTFDLIISPKLRLTVGEEEREVGIGEFLYRQGENLIYLVGVSSKKDINNKEILTAWFASINQSKRTSTGNLTAQEINSFSSLISDLAPKTTGSTLITKISNSIVGAVSWINKLVKLTGKEGAVFAVQSLSDPKDVFGTSIEFKGFATPENKELSQETQEKYDLAMENYQTVIDSYSSELKDETRSDTYGEEALYQQIALSYSTNQKLKVQELCTKFSESYPSSSKKIEEYCSEKLISGTVQNEHYAVINGETKKVSLQSVYEPSFEEYGVRLEIDSATNSQSLDLKKGEIVYLNGNMEGDDDGDNFCETGESCCEKDLEGCNNDNHIDRTNDFVKLVSTNSGSSTIKISIDDPNLMKKIKNQFGGDTINLEINTPKTVGDYTFTVTKINLVKSAKVSLSSSITDSGTQANFSFKIGIEQRTIKLSPEQTKMSIEKLDKEIKTWGNISGVLEGVNEGLKASCIATAAGLIVKNFITGAGSEGIARSIVMKGANGWYEQCGNDDACLNKNADQIDQDVADLSKIIDTKNSEIKKLQDNNVKTSSFIGGTVIDTNGLVEDLAVTTKEDLTSLDTSLIDKTKVNLDSVLKVLDKEGYASGQFTLDQLKDISLYYAVLTSEEASEGLKTTAQSELNSILESVTLNSKTYNQIKTTAEDKGITAEQVTAVEIGENAKSKEYTGLQLKDVGSIPDVSPTTPVGYIQTTSGKKYIAILDNSAKGSTLPIKALYEDTGSSLISVATTPQTIVPLVGNIYFQKYSSALYKNSYTNAKLTYYETSPYKGMPAIVPIDTKNGWYAGIKQSLNVLGGSTSYDASGRIGIFYLCNVGENGLQEFSSGNDECQRIDLSVSQTYEKFSGLSSSEISKLVTKAVTAIEQAQKAYKSGLSGKVKILDSLIEVGAPAVDTSEFRCQDFMSPKDCLLLFNLCDPVICPSSRCDFGGTYAVKDVVQSGIIGSLLLCLPNAKEGIIMPVCLTGVKAGIDSLISVKQSYRDCLNESLETGKMVGLCDEVYSFYLCDFFWRQASPLAELVVPKLFEAILGQNVRGGGEYFSITDSWSTTQKAVNYFINFYGVNAKEAFIARTSEGIGGEICKYYSSSVVGEASSVIDSLIQSDSPAQYTGRFDEIPLSSVTVPPTSQYKVYYHIYSGTDAGAYYKVYLKGTSGSSYYHDTDQSVIVASGYISVGDYASETKDIIATSGYTELCISVNGDEECGFTETSTSFTVNYLSDLYSQYLANKTNIKTETACASGVSEGIIRTCATSNPGNGTDANVGTEDARWQDVGYCDSIKLRCWLDTDSVKDSIKLETTEEDTLDSISQSYLENLNEENFIDDSEFALIIKEIEAEDDPAAKLTLLDSAIEQTVMNNKMAQLLSLRGEVYQELAILNYQKEDTPTSSTDEGSSTVTTPSSDENSQEGEDTSTNSISSASNQVLEAAATLEGESSSSYDSSIKAVLHVYANANVLQTCNYSDPAKKIYRFKNSYTNGETKTINTKKYPYSQDELLNKINLGFFVYGADQCENIGEDTLESSKEKLDNIQPGDIISYIWDDSKSHNAIFIKWTKPEERIAKLFDGNREGTFGYYEENLSDDSHGVYAYWTPVQLEDTAPTYFDNSIEDPSDETLITTFSTKEILASSTKLDAARTNVINTIGSSVGTTASGTNCWQAISAIYSKAGVTYSCTYSDPSGKQYSSVTALKTGGKGSVLQINTKACTSNDYPQEKKLSLLQPGDIISYVYSEKIGHNAIFVGWENEEERIAKLFDWNGKDKNGKGHYYRYYSLVNLQDTKHPVYMVWKPVAKTSSSTNA